MTYCIGLRLDQGMIFATDFRTNAGIDTPYFQTGETTYGKPNIDSVIARQTKEWGEGTRQVFRRLPALAW